MTDDARVAVWATLDALGWGEATRPRGVLQRALAEGLEADVFWTGKFLDRLAAVGLIRETVSQGGAEAVAVELGPMGDALCGRRVGPSAERGTQQQRSDRFGVQV